MIILNSGFICLSVLECVIKTNSQTTRQYKVESLIVSQSQHAACVVLSMQYQGDLQEILVSILLRGIQGLRVDPVVPTPCISHAGPQIIPAFSHFVELRQQ